MENKISKFKKNKNVRWEGLVDLTWNDPAANFPEAESLAFARLMEKANLQTHWATGIVISQ